MAGRDRNDRNEQAVANEAAITATPQVNTKQADRTARYQKSSRLWYGRCYPGQVHTAEAVVVVKPKHRIAGKDPKHRNGLGSSGKTKQTVAGFVASKSAAYPVKSQPSQLTARVAALHQPASKTSELCVDCTSTALSEPRPEPDGQGEAAYVADLVHSAESKAWLSDQTSTLGSLQWTARTSRRQAPE